MSSLGSRVAGAAGRNAMSSTTDYGKYIEDLKKEQETAKSMQAVQKLMSDLEGLDQDAPDYEKQRNALVIGQFPALSHLKMDGQIMDMLYAKDGGQADEYRVVGSSLYRIPGDGSPPVRVDPDELSRKQRADIWAKQAGIFIHDTMLPEEQQAAAAKVSQDLGFGPSGTTITQSGGEDIKVPFEGSPDGFLTFPAGTGQDEILATMSKAYAGYHSQSALSQGSPAPAPGAGIRFDNNMPTEGGFVPEAGKTPLQLGVAPNTPAMLSGGLQNLVHPGRVPFTTEETELDSIFSRRR